MQTVIQSAYAVNLVNALLNFLKKNRQYFYYVMSVSLPSYLIETDEGVAPVITDGTRLYFVKDKEKMFLSEDDILRYAIFTIHAINTLLVGAPFIVSKYVNDESGADERETIFRKNVVYLLGSLIGLAKATSLTIKNELYEESEEFREVFREVFSSFVSEQYAGTNVAVEPEDFLRQLRDVLGTNIDAPMNFVLEDLRYYAFLKKELEIVAETDKGTIDLTKRPIWEVMTGKSPVVVTVKNKRAGASLRFGFRPVVVNVVITSALPQGGQTIQKGSVVGPTINVNANNAQQISSGSATAKKASSALRSGNMGAVRNLMKKIIDQAIETVKKMKLADKQAGVGRIEGETYQFELYDTEDEWLRWIKGLVAVGLTGPKNIPTWRRPNRRLPGLKPGFYPSNKPTLIFLMDVSGSMYVDKNLDKVLSELINVGRVFRSRIVWIQWSDGPSPPVTLRRQDIRKLKDEKTVKIDTGGTMIAEALRLALEELEKGKNRRAVVFITSDGYIGDADNDETIELLKEIIKKASLTIFATVDIIPPKFAKISDPKFVITRIKVRSRGRDSAQTVM